VEKLPPYRKRGRWAVEKHCVNYTGPGSLESNAGLTKRQKESLGENSYFEWVKKRKWKERRVRSNERKGVFGWL